LVLGVFLVFPDLVALLERRTNNADNNCRKPITIGEPRHDRQETHLTRKQVSSSRRPHRVSQTKSARAPGVMNLFGLGKVYKVSKACHQAGTNSDPFKPAR